jgi:TPP-dependent pyruvate/acetoin dehydrogenase alpha subunit
MESDVTTAASKWNRNSLIQFENEIAELFNSGQIPAPIHLNHGSEDQLIDIFREVEDQDWIFCSWRSHYQALLKGVPSEKVRQDIINLKSIALTFPEHRFFSSAIVGGGLPQAVGVAMGIKRRGGSEHVWCFIGDMTAEIGMASTAIKYSEAHSLPVTFVVEDNEVSVMTPTHQTWGSGKSTYKRRRPSNVRYFEYKSRYPHAGAGVRVEF